MPPVGARVRRGPDWKSENQDQNGPGTIVAHTGTCIDFNRNNMKRHYIKTHLSI